MSRKTELVRFATSAVLAVAVASPSLAQVDVVRMSDNPDSRRGLAIASYDPGSGYVSFFHGGETSSACSQTPLLLGFDPDTDGWDTTLSPSPAAQMYHSAVMYDDGTGIRLWTIGGTTCSSKLTTVQSYDPLTGTWYTEGSLNAGRATNAGAVVLNGTLYAILGDGSPSGSTTEVYDPVSGTWSYWTSRNHAEDGAAAVMGDKIVVVYSSSGITEIYDSVTAAWAYGPTLTGGINDTGVVVRAGGAVYALTAICGGVDQSLYRLRDDLSQWDHVADIAELNGITHYGATGLGAGRILVSGGAYCGGTTVSTETYLIQVPEVVVANNPDSRRGLILVHHDTGSGSTVYAHGGETSSHCSQTSLLESYDPDSDTWISPLTSSPAAQMYHSGVMYDDGTGFRLWAIGGTTCSSKQTTVQSFDPATGVWTTEASLNTGRATNSGAVVLNGTLYAIVGDGSPSGSTTEVYDPVNGIWSYWTPRNHAEDGAAAVLGDKIFVVYSSSGITEIYDSVAGSWSYGPTLLGGINDTGVVISTGGAVYALGAFCTGVDQPLYRLRADLSRWDHIADIAELNNITHFAATGLGDDRIMVTGGAFCGGTSVSDKTVIINLKDWPAAATFRNGGTNPASYTAVTLPQICTDYVATVDLSTTGHTHALLAGFGSPLTFTLGWGQTGLVNPTGPELLHRLPEPGPLATFTLPIPCDPYYVGFVVYTQAAHFGGVTPFALSNAIDLVIGY